MYRSVAPGGLVVAALGFALTRFTVTLAVDRTALQFVLAGLVPLGLGLGLATAGVVAAVGRFDPGSVRTFARWTLAGTGAAGLMVALTVLGTMPREGLDLVAVARRTYLSNFLIGGAVAGAVTGVYAARSRRQRADLEHQRNRLVTLNRLLREEVLNAVSVIEGRLDLLDRGDGDAETVVREQTDQIAATVEDVRSLTRAGRAMDGSLDRVDAVAALEAAADGVRSRHPAADVRIEAPDGATVWSTDQLREVFGHLLDNAVRYANAEAPTVRVAVETVPTGLRVRVSDEGPGLPARQRRLLETGEIAPYDDPESGFGLNVVRLLVESYEGTIDTAVEAGGTTVTVTLRRPTRPDQRPSSVHLDRAGLDRDRVALAVGTGLVAGVGMGVAIQATAGVVPVIGALYGLTVPSVGWITHVFHSVVFALVFAAALEVLPDAYARTWWRCLGVALAWSLLLFVVAAGLVMPAWLRVVGVSAPLPNLSVATLAGHLVWGTTAGLLYGGGVRWLAARAPERAVAPAAVSGEGAADVDRAGRERNGGS